MVDVVIVGDTARCPELRHELPLDVLDPLTYVEAGGERHVFLPSLEAGRVDELGLAIECHPLVELGWDEICAAGGHLLDCQVEASVRACRLLGVGAASVPGAFPAAHADGLRAAGIAITVDQGLFDERRRRKSPAELTGIGNAQRAAEAAFDAATTLLRAARTTGGLLHHGGDVLTVERVKATIQRSFAEHGCTADDIVVAPGPQGAGGHVMGTGPIAAGVPVIIDLWPRDRGSGCFADMTRTVSVGRPAPEVVAWHRVTLEARAAAAAAVRPGASCRAVFDAACDVFEAAGYATLRTKRPGVALDHGFMHGLGHGVGLQVHEAPLIGPEGGGVLAEGDVIALEPGLYDPAVGGVRIEDILRVTADGHEVLTTAPYALEL